LYNDLVGEGLTRCSCFERPSSNPNTLASDVTIVFILNYDVSVDLHETTGSRVNIHDNSPVAVNCHIFSRQRHPSLRPLGSIAPVSNKALFDKLIRRSWAQIAAVNSCNRSGFKVSSVQSACTYLQSSVAYSIVLEILTVSAVILVKNVRRWKEEIFGGEGITWPIRSDIKGFPMECIVKFKDDGRIAFSKVAGGCHLQIVEI
jgi:hypothetical protein